MASDIEKLANNLRELAAHAKNSGQEVGQGARDVAQLVDTAHAQGRSGLSVGRLVGQLQAAAKWSRAAADALDQVSAHGDGFADHLAATRHGHDSHPIRDGIFAFGVLANVVSSPTPAVSSTDTNSGTGTHEVAPAIEHAATDHQNWEAANQLAKKSSDDIADAETFKRLG